jgi:hypothetical protein
VPVAIGDGEAVGTGLGVVVVTSQPATAAAMTKQAITRVTMFMRIRNLPMIRPCVEAHRKPTTRRLPRLGDCGRAGNPESDTIGR